MIKQSQKNLETFFQSCSDPAEEVLVSFLDTDTCPKISCKFNEFAEIGHSKDLITECNVVYKFDFVVDEMKSEVFALLPENLIVKISDILTGGSGNIVYKGAISEIESNSVKKIIEKILNEITAFFKLNYDKNLVFGSDFNVLLKEMDGYEDSLMNSDLNFVAMANLTLTDLDDGMPIKILLNKKFVSTIMSRLGFDETVVKTNYTNVDLSALSNIQIDITAELGRTKLPIKYAMELTKGSLVELETLNNQDIKIYANGLVFAYAQIVAVDDNFGLRITKIISPEERFGCV